MRRGLVLTELMLIVALAGILAGIALPHLSVILDGIEVGAAAVRLAAAHSRARMMAVSRSQVLVLSVSQDSLIIRPHGAAASVWAEAGPAASGVTLHGVARQFTFAPEGFTLGLSNASLRLSRGGATRTVIVSRLGRIRITR